MMPTDPIRASLRHALLRRRGAHIAGGFSLVELMISLTIGLLIIVAISAVYVTSSAGKKTDARFAEMQTNARYTIDSLRREIQHAGFCGLTYVDPAAPPCVIKAGTSLGATTNDCGTGFATDFAKPIQGANDTNPYSGTCIPAANYARGDILVLRRAGPEPKDPAAAHDADTLYFRSAFSQGTVFLGSNAASTTVTHVSSTDVPVDYPLDARVYYISPHTKSSTESPKVPALYRLSLKEGPVLTSELVASNIENMQVQYGVSTSAGIQFLNASSVNAADWARVTAVRLWLLARSSDPDPGYANTTTYTIGDQSITASDGYQRQVFQQIVQLRK